MNILNSELKVTSNDEVKKAVAAEMDNAEPSAEDLDKIIRENTVENTVENIGEKR